MNYRAVLNKCTAIDFTIILQKKRLEREGRAGKRILSELLKGFRNAILERFSSNSIGQRRIINRNLNIPDNGRNTENLPVNVNAILM